ncbi:hypothetical protein, partial [Nocardia brasiliensis]|uniref:hypothetical protein n=1 Tax=Nocardia brasiliensis TaxID=37326 RepID=UPI002457BE8F
MQRLIDLAATARLRSELALSNRDTHRAVACGPRRAWAAGCGGAGGWRRCPGGGRRRRGGGGAGARAGA